VVVEVPFVENRDGQHEVFDHVPDGRCPQQYDAGDGRIITRAERVNDRRIAERRGVGVWQYAEHASA